MDRPYALLLLMLALWNLGGSVHAQSDAAEADLWWSSTELDHCICNDSPLQRAPNMIGDFFHGYRAGLRGSSVLDRLLVAANDLDAPIPLPPAGATLTLTEPGPVGIFSTSLVSVQELQALLRAGTPLPPATLVGTIGTDATLTTTLTIAQIQALLAGTPQAQDIVPLVPPPASYDAGVLAAFVLRNSGSGAGTIQYEDAASGAILQGGADALAGGEDLDAFYFYSYLIAVDVPTPGAGLGNAGRLKVADGNSPLPHDRVYYRYGMFDGVPISTSGVSVDRFTLGFEQTVWDGIFSVEMRIPFAASVDSDITSGGAATGHDVEFGNLAAYLKALLYYRERVAVSAGLGVTSPTASEVNIRLSNGTPLIRIENDSAHLQPFIAGLYAPDDRLFVQGFLQLDLDTNGNSLLANTGSGLAPAGRLNDSTFLMADLGLCCWLYRSTCDNMTGIAPTVELHYNSSLQPADNVAVDALRIGNFGDHVESLNLTAGATFEFGDATRLSVGYVAPLGNGQDRQLDSGLRVLLDHRPWCGI